MQPEELPQQRTQRATGKATPTTSTDSLLKQPTPKGKAASSPMTAMGI